MQIADHLNYSPVYCVFDLSQGLGSEKIFAIFSKWTRKIVARLKAESEALQEATSSERDLQNHCDFLIAKRSYTIKVSLLKPPAEEEAHVGDPVQIYSDEELELTGGKDEESQDRQFVSL